MWESRVKCKEKRRSQKTLHLENAIDSVHPGRNIIKIINIKNIRKN